MVLTYIIIGILLAVAALESLGTLFHFAEHLTETIPMLGTEPEIAGYNVSDLVIMIFGVASAVIDNVPLVAASIGMFSDPTDSPLWHFIAFSAGTGGSMLIIGSAAGVVAMGMEKINFFWYLKNIAWLALVGFLVGSFSFMFLRSILPLSISNIGICSSTDLRLLSNNLWKISSNPA